LEYFLVRHIDITTEAVHKVRHAIFDQF